MEWEAWAPVSRVYDGFFHPSDLNSAIFVSCIFAAIAYLIDCWSSLYVS